MRLEELTYQQIDALDRDTVAVFPLAAVEQHGPHLPLVTDTAIATGLAQRLDDACDNRLLILPTFWLGCSAHHRTFPGSLSTQLDHWSACVVDVADSVLSAGFRKLLLMNTHGGNGSILAVTLEKIKYLHPDATAVGAMYWSVAREAMAQVRESDLGGMGHACEMETSLMLCLRPELVDMSKAQRDGHVPASQFSRFDMLNAPRVIVHRTMRELTDRGVYGDPTLASKEKGERFFAAIVPRMKQLVDDLQAGRM